MAYKRKKHIWYSSGLLSLVLFPLLCLYFMGQNGLYTDLRVMEINWFSEKNWQYLDGPHLFPLDFKSNRKYIDITLTDDGADNQNKLAAAQLQVRALRISKDTIQGIHFHFEDNMPYEAFVQVMNIGYAEHGIAFVPDSADVWVFNYVPKPNPEYEHSVSFCGNTSMRCLPPAFPPEEEIQKERLQLLKQTLYAYSPVALLFFIMAATSFWSFKKHFQTLN